jgi:uncharacterized protein (DUF4415 family)
MTPEELRALIARGESQSRPLPAGREPDVCDPDNPEMAAAIRAATKQVEPSHNPTPKVSAELALDADVLEAFRAGGGDWQNRINAALREWLKTHSP